MIADIIVQDSSGRDLLIVVVRGGTLGQEIVNDYFELLESMEAICPSVPFGMVVDLEVIHVKKMGFEARVGTSCTLDSRAIFRHYDSQYGTKRIFHHYLITLTEAWLHDLASRWTASGPPGADALAELGLLERLEGSETQREVPLGIDSLR